MIVGVLCKSHSRPVVFTSVSVQEKYKSFNHVPWSGTTTNGAPGVETLEWNSRTTEVEVGVGKGGFE